MTTDPFHVFRGALERLLGVFRVFRGRLRLLPRACTIRLRVADLVFFYGTLMAGFDRRRRAGIDDKLAFIGRGINPGGPLRPGPLSGCGSGARRPHLGRGLRDVRAGDCARRARRDRRLSSRTIPIEASIPGRRRMSSFPTAALRSPGCTSTMRRSAAPRASRQATISNTSKCDDDAASEAHVGCCESW